MIVAVTWYYSDKSVWQKTSTFLQQETYKYADKEESSKDMYTNEISTGTTVIFV